MNINSPAQSFFDDILYSFGAIRPSNSFSIPTDIYRQLDETGKEKELVFEFAIAGLNVNDIHIWLDDNVLNIEHKKSLTDEPPEKFQDKIYTQRDISRKSWKLKYRLVGNKLRKDLVYSEYENGVLKVVVPVVQEEKTVKEISIGIKQPLLEAA